MRYDRTVVEQQQNSNAQTSTKMWYKRDDENNAKNKYGSKQKNATCLFCS